MDSFRGKDRVRVRVRVWVRVKVWVRGEGVVLVLEIRLLLG